MANINDFPVDPDVNFEQFIQGMIKRAGEIRLTELFRARSPNVWFPDLAPIMSPFDQKTSLDGAGRPMYCKGSKVRWPI